MACPKNNPDCVMTGQNRCKDDLHHKECWKKEDIELLHKVLDFNVSLIWSSRILGLTVSDYWTRAKESVRFDEENCDILCVRDHAYFETHKTEYEVWKKNRMGEKAFNLLMARAHVPGKRDDKLQVMLIKKLMKEQNQKTTIYEPSNS
jgi:hypothetical protein